MGDHSHGLEPDTAAHGQARRCRYCHALLPLWMRKGAMFCSPAHKSAFRYHGPRPRVRPSTSVRLDLAPDLAVAARDVLAGVDHPVVFELVRRLDRKLAKRGLA